ncbi:MAG: tryptophan-rich sensory protein [Cyanobacteria bacterium P01_C01_bin.120]
MKGAEKFGNSGWALAIATPIAIIGTLVVNTLSNFYPPGGKNVGEIANTTLAGVLITPANYAFAIWGLIYLGLIAYGIYQLGANQRRDPIIRPVNRLLIIACVIQMGWIFLFTLQYFTGSTVAMLGILLSLMGAYGVLRMDRIDRRRRWLAVYPISIYLAWISVATIINVASALYDAGWRGGLTGVAWTVIMIWVSVAIALFVIFTRQDIPFTLVYVWAYVAIAVRHADTPAILVTSIAASVLLVGMLALVRLGKLPFKTG